MTLRALLSGVSGATVTGPDDVAVSGLSLDSRRTRPGDAFFALAGMKDDGSRFVPAAIAAGAIAVVGPPGTRATGTTVVEVPEPRLALAQAACTYHGNPSADLRVVAVTGTNGKTTTTFMVEAIARAAGLSCGVIGTTGVRLDGETRPSAFTTPEAPELQALLAQMRERDTDLVAIEVSSHALVQRRSWGLQADVAVFTNLTQDHLDFHGTMDAYLDAKRMLFDGRNAGPGRKRAVVVVNGDDPASDAIAAAAAGHARSTVRFGASAHCDVRVDVTGLLPAGVRMRLAGTLAGKREAVEFVLPMLGRHNAHNAAAALTGAVQMDGIEVAAAVTGLSTFAGVPGRLERVDAGQPFTAVVDYAHTPDALARALGACREHARGRVLCVFGCGGDRDRGKRPQMGALAARLADAAWVTNDNPRSEDPAAIAREIVAGAPQGALVTVLDRREAIGAAVAAAHPGDVVLIAGKGHETTQTIGAVVTPFDDRIEVRRAVEAHR